MQSRRPGPDGQDATTRARGVRRVAPALLALLLVALLAGCSTAELGADTGEIPQNALDPAPGSPAEASDTLWDIVFPIAIGVFVLVQGLLIYSMWRFRHRGEAPDKLPRQVAGNTRLEILWTIIPALILAAIAVPTVSTIFELSDEPEDPLEVLVIGKQYFWEFQYLNPEYDEVVTANELYIPTGRDVQLRMQSVSAVLSYNPFDETLRVDEAGNPFGEVAEGVMHSFWVPRLAGKQDLVPGHTREMTIRTDVPDVYEGQCAEFCGLSHANMRLRVIAQEPDDFEAYIASQQEAAEVQTAGLALEGQQLFTSATCIACHAIEGYPANGEPGAEVLPIDQQARVGPNLTHFSDREIFAGILQNTDEQLAAWLRNPQAEKPGAQMPNLGLSEEDIDALIAYMRTLGGPQQAAAGGG